MALVNPEGLTANFTIGKVYYNGTTSGGTTAITKICNKKGIPMEVLKEGDHLEIGGVSLDVINPTAAVSASEVSTTQEANNSSICVFFTYGDIKALFVGDMYTKETVSAIITPYMFFSTLSVPCACGERETINFPIIVFLYSLFLIQLNTLTTWHFAHE